MSTKEPFHDIKSLRRPLSARSLGLASSIMIVLVLQIIFASREAIGEQHPIQEWEPLLWGGNIVSVENTTTNNNNYRDLFISIESIIELRANDGPGSVDQVRDEDQPAPNHLAGLTPAKLAPPLLRFPKALARRPYNSLVLRNIPPLYSSPRIPGEGEWESESMPKLDSQWPVIYRTTYRPSVEYPNAIVHMALFDMRSLAMRLYLGSSEPGATEASSEVAPGKVPYLVAITNAMWKQKHSRGAGAIYRGKVINELAQGMATLLIYKDNTVDIVEWDEDMDVSQIMDARQLRHLIVKDGKVVKTVSQGGRKTDAEIGLGFLLVEDDQLMGGFGGYGYGYGYMQAPSGPVSTRYMGDQWFIATRSAFGIRPDGNLVFAIGHHISTKDLAKALVLAGCVRAIHGDANPHNVVGNFYYTDPTGRIIRKEKLSPDQKDHTLNRYVGSSYTSDFFAFFTRKGIQPQAHAQGK